ncbi:MAG: hypothetical protein ACUVX8_03255 [Candidatus Zipacnadales bacterium]
MPAALEIAMFLALTSPAWSQEAKPMTLVEKIQAVLAATNPLAWPRGNRLPIRAMGLEGLPTGDDTQNERLLRELDARGFAVSARWNPAHVETSLAEGIRLGRLQQKLGLQIGVNANACMHRFFNGDPQTAHITEEGEPFFDSSFGEQYKMGCPFAMESRYGAIKEQFEVFLRAYRDAGLTVDFIYLDWEIDGPIEWNGAWEASQRCQRCREHLPNLEDFTEFQRVLRTLRAQVQREVFTETVQAYFPTALIGNYAVYPHNGERYWYDYFEVLPEGAPFRLDQRAKYRPWFDEFPLTGYTFAMPVVYTWYPTFGWYDFAEPDYRWFYNMLLVASNACAHTPPEVPVIAWLHWHTTAPPPNPDPTVKQFSEGAYQELIWHMLLRGCDGLMNWCMTEETVKELQLIQEVYAASLEYHEFLESGQPVTFHVPPDVAPVVSGLRLGDRLLVRRTDFGTEKTPVKLTGAGLEAVSVPAAPGRCQIINLNP